MRVGLKYSRDRKISRQPLMHVTTVSNFPKEMDLR